MNQKHQELQQEKDELQQEKDELLEEHKQVGYLNTEIIVVYLLHLES